MSEWCRDWYVRRYDIGVGLRGDGLVIAPGPRFRVTRGGSMSDTASNVRSAGRSRLDPSARLNSLGFRVSAPCH